MAVALRIEQAHVAACLPAVLVRLAHRTAVGVRHAPLVVAHPYLTHLPRRQLTFGLAVDNLDVTRRGPTDQVEALNLRDAQPLVAADDRVAHRLGRAIELIHLVRPEPVAPGFLEPRRARRRHVEDPL